ncbi:MAG: cytochrome c, partial [Gammaproteobacteria bacterium]|nr:cytochrome c [Gammaproteobacteria bacterium]
MNKTIVMGLFSGMALVPALAGAQISADPTYSNEVARIMQDNCQICHQEGNIGPMPFTSYDEVRPYVGLIREAVISREMPPYHYDRDIGIQELKEDWRLDQEDIDTIVAWVDSGAPEGNSANL